ncbi:MFS transporter [Fluoribacter dumoffii]|uniref:Enterobactin exporter EntS n=1 Tax=Fluoribacter dumoffii TaxID=463 RepID=A0A377G9R4_9GAMM|nr:MFS transporter [Fluoribacter dumoffii]KTC90134.1 permease of the major facilitator superfamily protein [Fluoribacter dumoffii NY 23]MCW8385430.1 MFS transporter [Fluoribacter dumoffii]MCW8418483.1 MFS transporter [Fluoribacter dumoffii]MCW8453675.1 MFS transporter [Fluoribacter dumoffii]MCW8459107.1 MFS transporter [Fluoribacter dumoffii]
MSNFLDLSLLKKNRDFRLLYFGQFISFIGTMISSVALPYQIYQMTQSTYMVGLLSLVQLLPLLVTALIGGVFADRYNRRGLLIISELLLAGGCCLLALNSYHSAPSLTLIFIISAAMSGITGLHRPAFDSVTQQIVNPHDYKSVGALATFKFSFCMIIAPAISGLIIAQYGIVITYLLDLLTFAMSLVTLIKLHNIPKPEVKEHPSILSSLKQGVSFAYNRQELMGSYMVDFIAMVFAWPNSLLPAVAQSFGGAKTLGLLYSAPAVGALFISFFSGWTAKINHDGKAIAIAAALWGATIIGFGLSSSLWLVLFFLALAGAFDAISGIFRTTLWNNTIPTEYRGRLAGIEMISYLSGPKLGDTRAGFIASTFSISASLISGGILCIVGVTVSCLIFPKFWHYRSHLKNPEPE